MNEDINKMHTHAQAILVAHELEMETDLTQIDQNHLHKLTGTDLPILVRDFKPGEKYATDMHKPGENTCTSSKDKKQYIIHPTVINREYLFDIERSSAEDFEDITRRVVGSCNMLKFYHKNFCLELLRCRFYLSMNLNVLPGGKLRYAGSKLDTSIIAYIYMVG